MCNANSLGTSFLQSFVKPLVSLFPSRHLDAHVMTLSIASCAEMLDGNGDVVLSAQTSAEGFVAIALDTAKLKVAVEGLYTIAQFL